MPLGACTEKVMALAPPREPLAADDEGTIVRLPMPLFAYFFLSSSPPSDGESPRRCRAHRVRGAQVEVEAEEERRRRRRGPCSSSFAFLVLDHRIRATLGCGDSHFFDSFSLEDEEEKGKRVSSFASQCCPPRHQLPEAALHAPRRPAAAAPSRLLLPVGPRGAEVRRRGVCAAPIDDAAPPPPSSPSPWPLREEAPPPLPRAAAGRCSRFRLAPEERGRPRGRAP